MKKIKTGLTNNLKDQLQRLAESKGSLTGKFMAEALKHIQEQDLQKIVGEAVKKASEATQTNTLTHSQMQEFLNYQEDEQDLYFGLDMRERPVVVFPEEDAPVAYPVRHGRVRAWLWEQLVTFFHLSRKPDISLALQWIECRAYDAGILEVQFESHEERAAAIYDEPLSVAVINRTRNMRVGEELVETPTDGFNQLTHEAQLHCHDVKDWPKCPSALCRQLKANLDFLREIIGVEFTVETPHEGRLWRWKRVSALDPMLLPETVASSPRKKEREAAQRGDDMGVDLFEELKKVQATGAEAAASVVTP